MSGNRDSRTCEHPAWPLGGARGARKQLFPRGARLGRARTGAIVRERTWPSHARHPPRQDLAWAISAGLRGLDRTDKEQRRARARKTKAVPGEGGVVRRRRCADPGAWRAHRFTGRRFLFHAAAAPISTRPPFSGSLGPTEGDARCPYVSGAAARAFAHRACLPLAVIASISLTLASSTRPQQALKPRRDVRALSCAERLAEVVIVDLLHSFDAC